VFTLPLLSFREYLMLVLNDEIEVFDPFHPPKGVVRKMLREINVLRHFKDYLDGGFRPFFLEDPRLYQEKVMNTLAKTMEADIPFLVPQITENHLRMMHAVIGYLAVSNVPTLQVNSLCNEWSMGKEKLYQLLDAMERAHLVRTIRKRHDTKINSVGAKLLLHEPAIYGFFGKNEGTRREAYVAAALTDAGHKVYAATDETECDFMVNELRLEVGGKTKRAKAADMVVRDAVDVPSGNVIPMWMLGLGY
jgi:predicted AAA+ superfamily ATPase